jgi:hypothetical protein
MCVTRCARPQQHFQLNEGISGHVVVSGVELVTVRAKGLALDIGNLNNTHAV